MKSIIQVFTYFFIFFLTIESSSQVKELGIPDVKNFKRKEYKGGTQNWDINQDKKGNMYFANNKGLLKFDGTSWHLYPLPDNQPIKSLKVDDTGRVYVGGNNEFGYFSSNNKGVLVYHSLSDLLKKNKKKIKNINLIWKIHYYQGEIIFQSFTKLFFLKKNKLRYYETKNRFQFSFLVNNKLYIQDKKLGLVSYSKGKLSPLKGTSAINNSEVWAIFPNYNNQLIIATLENGLFIYDNKTLKPWKTEVNEFIKNNASLGGCIIQNKLYVFNTVNNGIIITDLNGRIIQHLNREKGIQNNTVLKSFIDKNNNLWLGLDNGIAFINENSPLTYFDYSYNIGTVYTSLVHKNILYVGTNQGLFYHNWDDVFLDKPFKRVEGTITQVWNIQLIDNQLLCATNNGALLIENNRVAKILDKKGYFGFSTIPNHPDCIIGNNYSGFSIFKKRGNTFELENSIAGLEETTNIFETLLDGNYLWLKKGSDLHQVELSDDLKRTNKIKIHTKINKNHKGIGSIQRINGKVYFQTQNQFYRYSEEQDLFFEDNKISSLFKSLPPLKRVFEDKYGNLWYCYNETIGVMKKNKNGNYTKNQTPFSNLTGNLVSDYLSINVVNHNNVFIGLTEGLAHFNFSIPNNSTTNPVVYFESFTSSLDTIRVSNLNKNYSNFNLDYSSNNVKFTFTSPIYEDSHNITYSYKLEPFEDNWTEWSPNTMKEYTNLKEGLYVMKVKVKNSYGKESVPAKLYFTISPPWYRHALAYLFYLLLCISIAFYIYDRMKLKIRKNKYYETIEQRRLYLEKESKIRQEQFELEKEIEKLKNDKLQIQILAKDKELVTNSLQVVKTNKVLNGILQKVKEIDIKDLDEPTKFQVTKLNKSIVKEVNNDKSWKDLEKHIKNVHFDFLKRLKEKYPTISSRELDLSTYLLMNMSTKEIAEIMNISIGGVELARYRLRKKIGLNKKENLIGFLMSI